MSPYDALHTVYTERAGSEPDSGLDGSLQAIGEYLQVTLGASRPSVASEMRFLATVFEYAADRLEEGREYGVDVERALPGEG